MPGRIMLLLNAMACHASCSMHSACPNAAALQVQGASATSNKHVRVMPNVCLMMQSASILHDS
jgi:hypothetical protein